MAEHSVIFRESERCVDNELSILQKWFNLAKSIAHFCDVTALVSEITHDAELTCDGIK